MDATETEGSCPEALVRKAGHQRGVGCKGEPSGKLGCGGVQRGVWGAEVSRERGCRSWQSGVQQGAERGTEVKREKSCLAEVS